MNKNLDGWLCLSAEGYVFPSCIMKRDASFDQMAREGVYFAALALQPFSFLYLI